MSKRRPKPVGDPPPYAFDEVSLLAGRLQGIETVLTNMRETLDALEHMTREWEAEYYAACAKHGVRPLVFVDIEEDKSERG